MGAVQGGFVVTWTADSPAGADVYARAFDPSGLPIGGEFKVNQATPGDQVDSRVLTYGTGSDHFITSWVKNGGGGQDGVFLRRHQTDGAPGTGDIMVASEGGVSSYDIDRHSSGTIVACWKAADMSCRKVDSQLQPTGSPFTVGVESPDQPAVVVRDTNTIWVIYDRMNMDKSGRGVIREELDMEGNSLRFAIIANWHETGDQYAPFATLTGTDDVTIGWESDGQDGSADGIYFRVLD